MKWLNHREIAEKMTKIYVSLEYIKKIH